MSPGVLSRLLRSIGESEQVRMLTIAVVIGVAAALGALAFRAMILGTEVLFWGTGDLSVAYIREMPWYWKLLLPAIGGLLIAPIVVRWAPDARGSGIPEIIEAVALHGGAVKRRIVPLKMLAASICIGTGGSAGREGPIVHIGGAIGSWLATQFRCGVKETRTYVGCGVAAGIAATFNAPFAGALFAVEVVLGDLGTAKISPIVIASIVATVISRHYSGNFPHIEVPAFEDTTNLLTMMPYLFVGLACGLVSTVFIRMMGVGWKLAGRWRFSPWLMPAFGGLCVGAIGLMLPHVYGVGYDSINMMLSGEIGWGLLLGILLAKLLATTLTLASGGSGGVFAPSLFVGAAVGGLGGALMMWLFPTVYTSPVVFVLVGMGAVVAGTTRAPISAILIIFELTYQPSVILPLMTACIPAIMLSAWLNSDSIYIARLTHKGVRLRKRTDLNLLKGMQVRDVMRKRVQSVGPNTPLMDLVDRFLESPFPVMWMRDEHGRLLGTLESQNLKIAMLERESLLALVLAEDVAAPPRAMIGPEDDLSLAMSLFNDAEHEILPVVDAENCIVGDLLRSDVIAAYNQELAVRDSLGTAVDAIGVAERLGNVDLGGGYALVEFDVPAHLVGKTLVELDLRRKHGIQAILLKRGEHRIVPGPDTRLETGDILLLAGETGRVGELVEKL